METGQKVIEIKNFIANLPSTTFDGDGWPKMTAETEAKVKLEFDLGNDPCNLILRAQQKLQGEYSRVVAILNRR